MGGGLTDEKLLYTQRGAKVYLNTNGGEVSLFGMHPEADAIDGEQPSDTVRIYKFYKDGIGGTLLRTVTVTYTDSTRDDIDSVTAVEA